MIKNKIILGDCLEIMRKLPPDCFDAVIVDPPYNKKFMLTLIDIAIESSRILKPHGSFVSIVPHYSLPTVIPAISSFLTYRWIFAMWQEEGAHPRMAMGIEVLWKPIIWWVKDTWKTGRGFVPDGFINRPPKKEYHEWEQSMDWADFCVTKFTREGEFILDPLCGSGTLLLSALSNNRFFLGIDNDLEAVKIARRRVKNASA